MNTSTSSDRIISAKERRELVPYSCMHIWRLERAGRFPRRIHLGPNRVGWSLAEIDEWIEGKKAERGRGARQEGL
jgi:prophage regulatory protein